MGAEPGSACRSSRTSARCIESPKPPLELLDRCPGLTITLDPSHFVYVGWTVPTIWRLLARTRHVQIRPGGHGVMQCKVPENQVDLDAAVRFACSSNGYSGWIASEYVWMEKWRCDEVDNTSGSGPPPRSC